MQFLKRKIKKWIRIFEIYKKNVGKKTFFVDIEIVDWYDSPISGFAKIRNLNEGCFFFIIAWDLKSDDKVFIFINVSLAFIKQWKTKNNKIEYDEMKKTLFQIV